MQKPERDEIGVVNARQPLPWYFWVLKTALVLAVGINIILTISVHLMFSAMEADDIHIAKYKPYEPYMSEDEKQQNSEYECPTEFGTRKDCESCKTPFDPCPRGTKRGFFGSCEVVYEGIEQYWWYRPARCPIAKRMPHVLVVATIKAWELIKHS